MKRCFVVAGCFWACVCGLHAQVVDTTVCDVLKNPESFNGKMVRIKGTVVAGFDQFDRGCDGPQLRPSGGRDLALLSAGDKGQGGTGGDCGRCSRRATLRASSHAPARTPVTLDKSKDFKQFDSLLAQKHQKGADMCLGCTRYEVTATLVGRLDGVADAALKHDTAGKIVGFGGFGNLNAYPARLVLQSVADVTPKEVDYSKTDAATKGERCRGRERFEQRDCERAEDGGGARLPAQRRMR